MTKTRALINTKLHGSVTERIDHESCDMLTYCEKTSNSVRGRFFISGPPVTLK